MNKLQQAADEHGQDNCRPCNSFSNEEDCSCSLLSSAFLAGAAYADGEFAEWCSVEGWRFNPVMRLWEPKENGTWKTTPELYQLWQQSVI